jgi:hypothetical protein
VYADRAFANDRNCQAFDVDFLQRVSDGFDQALADRLWHPAIDDRGRAPRQAQPHAHLGVQLAGLGGYNGAS